jgi:rhodanese-related sulfurtransferase
MVAHARKQVPEVSATETKAGMDEGTIDVVLDVREPEEWKAGHIPGAVHAPRGMLEWLADPGYAKHNPQLAGNTEAQIVVHCAAGARSLLAAETLKRLGYKNVSSMAGGLEDWKAQGLPVEDGA